MPNPSLRCFDYVNQPYPRVREAILANPHYVFRHATAAAATQAATLHVKVGAIDVGAEVAIRIAGVENDHAYDRPATKIALEWQAENSPGMFPSMKATLVIFPLTSTETQLELDGTYAPPLGPLGKAFDAAVGHRLAEASIQRFIQEVAGWLREELTTASAIPDKPATPPEPAVLDTEC
jgi:hypothetical protein